MKTKIALFYRITRDAAAIVGLGAVAGFFWQERSPLWLVLAVLLLAGVWYTVFQLYTMGRKQVAFAAGKTPKVKPHEPRTPLTRTSAAPTHPEMRRRFVYFDAERGEDVYKMESVQ